MPLHPYTQALLSAIPIPDPDIEEAHERVILEVELPSLINPPSGCIPDSLSICHADLCREKAGMAGKRSWTFCSLPFIRVMDNK